ncbi:RNF37 protein, partial [Atractosteus spatula]|nr:RNF37 protein [Atractosteus spatula]
MLHQPPLLVGPCQCTPASASPQEQTGPGPRRAKRRLCCGIWLLSDKCGLQCQQRAAGEDGELVTPACLEQLADQPRAHLRGPGLLVSGVEWLFPREGGVGRGLGGRVEQHRVGKEEEEGTDRGGESRRETESGAVVDAGTLEEYQKREAGWGRPPNDPFTGVPFSRHSQPQPHAALKARIDRFLLQGDAGAPVLGRAVLRDSARPSRISPGTAGQSSRPQGHTPDSMPPGQNLASEQASPGAREGTGCHPGARESAACHSGAREGTECHPGARESAACHSGAREGTECHRGRKAPGCTRAEAGCASQAEPPAKRQRTEAASTASLGASSGPVSHEQQLSESLDRALTSALRGFPSFTGQRGAGGTEREAPGALPVGCGVVAESRVSRSALGQKPVERLFPSPRRRESKAVAFGTMRAGPAGAQPSADLHKHIIKRLFGARPLFSSATKPLAEQRERVLRAAQGQRSGAELCWRGCAETSFYPKRTCRDKRARDPPVHGDPTAHWQRTDSGLQGFEGVQFIVCISSQDPSVSERCLWELLLVLLQSVCVLRLPCCLPAALRTPALPRLPGTDTLAPGPALPSLRSPGPQEGHHSCALLIRGRDVIRGHLGPKHPRPLWWNSPPLSQAHRRGHGKALQPLCICHTSFCSIPESFQPLPEDPMSFLFGNLWETAEPGVNILNEQTDVPPHPDSIVKALHVFPDLALTLTWICAPAAVCSPLVVICNAQGVKWAGGSVVCFPLVVICDAQGVRRWRKASAAQRSFPGSSSRVARVSTVHPGMVDNPTWRSFVHVGRLIVLDSEAQGGPTPHCHTDSHHDTPLARQAP